MVSRCFALQMKERLAHHLLKVGHGGAVVKTSDSHLRGLVF